MKEGRDDDDDDDDDDDVDDVDDERSSILEDTSRGGRSDRLNSSFSCSLGKGKDLVDDDDDDDDDDDVEPVGCDGASVTTISDGIISMDEKQEKTWKQGEGVVKGEW